MVFLVTLLDFCQHRSKQETNVSQSAFNTTFNTVNIMLTHVEELELILNTVKVWADGGFWELHPLLNFQSPIHFPSSAPSLGFWQQVVFHNKNAQNPAFLLENSEKKFLGRAQHQDLPRTPPVGRWHPLRTPQTSFPSAHTPDIVTSKFKEKQSWHAPETHSLKGWSPWLAISFLLIFQPITLLWYYY